VTNHPLLRFVALTRENPSGADHVQSKRQTPARKLSCTKFAVYKMCYLQASSTKLHYPRLGAWAIAAGSMDTRRKRPLANTGTALDARSSRLGNRSSYTVTNCDLMLTPLDIKEALLHWKHLARDPPCSREQRFCATRQ